MIANSRNIYWTNQIVHGVNEIVRMRVCIHSMASWIFSTQLECLFVLSHSYNWKTTIRILFFPKWNEKQLNGFQWHRRTWTDSSISRTPNFIFSQFHKTNLLLLFSFHLCKWENHYTPDFDDEFYNQFFLNSNSKMKKKKRTVCWGVFHTRDFCTRTAHMCLLSVICAAILWWFIFSITAMLDDTKRRLYVEQNRMEILRKSWKYLLYTHS